MARSLLYMVLPLFLLSACGKEITKGPLDKVDGKPEKLTNIQVENISGGSKISYTLPEDYDNLYVLAEFSSRAGEQRIAKSSVYSDYIVLDGFANTDEYQVALYLINRSETRSEPVQVTIKPLPPPIHQVFADLFIENSFGGYRLELFNELEHEYVLYTLRKEENGNYELFDRLYTRSKKRDYMMVGLPPEPTEFAFFLMDKWRNVSDTLFMTITPLPEVTLDKSKFSMLYLDNDTNRPAGTDNPRLMWDNNIATRYRLHDSETADPPHWFTIDLGQHAKLSRLRLNQYITGTNYNWVFNRQSPRYFEIWASAEVPAQDGNWDNWVRLGEYESVKPSDLPPGIFSDEDIALAIRGEDFILPYTGIAYRYIRFLTVSTWDTRPNPYIGDITFYGEPL
ncbi:MAG TPA: DUF4959 domain-containing protein [Sphingobacterium sp.]|nr:DUF4959 domain-containing protein [Sphingobacterium sp.]